MSALSNNPAWALLNNDERVALSLHHSSDKSTWQAGEIMKKAHYKLLEIKARAEHFMRMFTTHYSIYADIIPDTVVLSHDFKQYINLTISKRLAVSEAIRKMDNDVYLRTKDRNTLISKEMLTLKRSMKSDSHNLLQLIHEFDNWNNFRILPRPLQQPSAFKRRNKNRHKKHLKTLLTIKPLSYKLLVDRYLTDPTTKQPRFIGYLPIIESLKSKDYEIIPIHTVKKVVGDLTKLGLYIFTTEAKADTFVKLIFEYHKSTNRHCTDGQRFWPDYRALIKSCINYTEIQNLDLTAQASNIYNIEL